MFNKQILTTIPEGGLSGYFSPAGGPTHPVVVPLGTPLGGRPLGSHLAPLTERYILSFHNIYVLFFLLFATKY